MLNVKNVARITEATNLTALAMNTDFNYAFCLKQFDRALALSKCFKYYRAKRCVWRYLPLANTYQDGGIGNVPQLQMIMNRTGDNTAWTPLEYDAQGATAETFTKQKTISYKPNLVQAVQVRADTAVVANPVTGFIPPIPIASSNLKQVGTRPLYNAWLSTPFSTVETVAGDANSLLNIYADGNAELLYWGHSIYVTGRSAANVATVFLEVEWEFKDPLYVTPPAVSAPEAPKALTIS